MYPQESVGSEDIWGFGEGERGGWGAEAQYWQSIKVESERRKRKTEFSTKKQDKLGEILKKSEAAAKFISNSNKRKSWEKRSCSKKPNIEDWNGSLKRKMKAS